MAKALITGITGQDGFYLAQHLVTSGHDVFGIVRGQNNPRRAEITAELPEARIINADLLDQASLLHALEFAQPDEIYNLAGLTDEVFCWGHASLALDVNAGGALRLLEAIRILSGHSQSRTSGPGIRYFQASIAMPGASSPYRASKMYAHEITKSFRRKYGMYACNGMLLDHDSPRSHSGSTARRITIAAAQIRMGLRREPLRIEDELRPWNYAANVVRAMPMALQQPRAADIMIGSGLLGLVSDFAQITLECAGLDPAQHLIVEPPTEDAGLRGNAKFDARMQRSAMGNLAGMMVAADIDRLRLPGTAVRGTTPRRAVPAEEPNARAASRKRRAA